MNLRKKNIDIILKGNEIITWNIQGADDSLQKTGQKQVTTRAITEFSDGNMAAVQRFLEFCDLRHVSPLNTAPVVLIDGKEALICLNGDNPSIPENAIWTNHPDLVGMVSCFFNSQWSNAKSGQVMLENLGPKKEKRTAT